MIASTMKIHPVLCLFLIGFCSSINFLLVTGNCLPHQRSLLLQLQTNLQFDPTTSTKLVRWNQSEDCCEWNGVTCQKGLVTSLDLSEEGIYGVKDNLSSLFSLQHLQSLNLADNSFDIEIPSAFHNLSYLRHLNLSDAGFVGQIPVEISKLTSLVTLDFSLLNLDNPNLPMLVQNMTFMAKLVLQGTTISPLENGWCQALSSSMPNLQVLDLSFCQLSGIIDSSLANFNNLTVLSLSGNNLSGWFPENIFQLKRLKFLDVSDNDYLEGSLPHVPKYRSLQTMRIAGTSFSGPIPDSISNLRYLSDLVLSSSYFNGTLPNSMSKLRELAYLDLSNNHFIGPIPSFNLSNKLIQMDLSNNDFSGTIPFTHFQGHSNLVYINLQGNSFKGSIPSSLFTLPLLQQVLLGRNEFNGQLNDLANTSIIEELDMSSNQLEGPIPSSLFNLTELNILYLYSNKFNGKIEMNMIQQLRNLEKLDLSFNKFSGNIELNMIQQLQNLTAISLSYNKLSCTDTPTTYSSSSSFPRIISLGLASCGLTTFPLFLKNNSEIGGLDLSENNIHGIIPIWIWNHTNLLFLNLSENYLTDWEETTSTHSDTSYLQFLDLHSNHLQRPLPVLFHPHLIYLDCSNNNISSTFPSDIDHRLSRIHYLFLSSNRFLGSIPKSVCNIKSLEVLELSNNSLTGTIPKCLFEKEQQTVLKLRSNKLIGTIDAFPSSCSLEILDVNGNFLRGKLPEYLVNCTRLEILDLGNNQINDKFPCRFKNISTLRVLILRSNNLHGSIECPSTQAAWPNLQIIDLAKNNLSGRIPPTFFKTWKTMMIDDKVTMSYLSRNIVEKCSGDEKQWKSLPPSENSHSSIDWNFISSELGFTFGVGMIILPLIFWNRWRLWYWERVDAILYRIFPQLDFVYEQHAGKNYRTLRWKPR
ncbi:hypothetical protein L6164_002351 [Bauhinia variegata]|uniref:Uncharacterized protein n=1 Tax=Bauhinia variegata TaxID=167791 RepID=A0ACB9PY22_BAUVA|nr:hypothetical protein L6164_002351 [Bauhinia variegata]